MELSFLDILGYYVNGDLICPLCVDVENGEVDTDNITSDEIFTREEMEKNEDVIFFCDRCKKQLKKIF